MFSISSKRVGGITFVKVVVLGRYYTISYSRATRSVFAA